jgi:hypothetical protein
MKPVLQMGTIHLQNKHQVITNSDTACAPQIDLHHYQHGTFLQKKAHALKVAFLPAMQTLNFQPKDDEKGNLA